MHGEGKDEKDTDVFSIHQYGVNISVIVFTVTQKRKKKKHFMSIIRHNHYFRARQFKTYTIICTHSEVALTVGEGI